MELQHRSQILLSLQASSCGMYVQLHPFFSSVVAIVSSSNFGISGDGYLDIYDFSERLPRAPITLSTAISPSLTYTFSCAVFALGWSESTPRLVAVGLGDGRIALAFIRNTVEICASLSTHPHECSGLDWNIFHPHQLLSCAWDGSVCFWDVANQRVISHTAQLHEGKIHAVRWSPVRHNVAATCGSDGNIKVVDIREMCNGNKLVKSVSQVATAQGVEVLTCDWNKYNPFLLAAGTSEGRVFLWDIRKCTDGNFRSPTILLESVLAHQLPVRSVRWSPFYSSVLATGSYDTEVKVWRTTCPWTAQILTHHSEFVMAVDWSLTMPYTLATTGWDCKGHIVDTQNNPPEHALTSA